MIFWQVLTEQNKQQHFSTADRDSYTTIMQEILFSGLHFVNVDLKQYLNSHNFLYLGKVTVKTKILSGLASPELLHRLASSPDHLMMQIRWV